MHAEYTLTPPFFDVNGAPLCTSYPTDANVAVTIDTISAGNFTNVFNQPGTQNATWQTNGAIANGNALNEDIFIADGSALPSAMRYMGESRFSGESERLAYSLAAQVGSDKQAMLAVTPETSYQ
jgi:hypothetical protein